jgi:hypothetical protein
MKRARDAAAVLLGALALCLAPSCARRGEPVATLIETQGTVERNDGPTDWTGVAPGFAFVVGDVLKTSARAEARLRLTNGTVIRVLENARIRFARGTLPAAAIADVNVELGSAEVENATADVALVTALGVARIERGAHVRVSSDGARAKLEVVVGRAVLLDPQGEVPVEQGKGARSPQNGTRPEIYDVVVGAPIVEAPAPARAVAPAAEPPAPPAPAPPPAAPAPDQAERTTAGRADVTLEAGDTGTVHVAASSLALRLAFDKLCPNDAGVEVKDGHGKRTVTGTGGVVLKLRPGTARYALRCAGDPRGAKPRASGSLTIKRDSGDVPVSRRPPTNALDADGRRYTVLFQTRLPALTLGWAGAPPGAANLTLHVESPAGAQTFPSPAASHRLTSGALAEGSYVWWYATADGRTSPKTTVTIRFDNAAPTAQFFPRQAAPAAGLVAVDGVTIDGAKVSAGGKSLTIDERGRFQADVAPRAGDDAVVVRLEHPRTGVHYYVRRTASRHHGRLAHAR